MFLLDTDVISELRRAGDGRADANVVAWLSSQDAGSLFISVITLLEPEVGTPRAS
jgi:predicted nucleic acid-binding protein